MIRAATFAGVVGICTVGCALDPVRDRPARLQLGMNARSFASSSETGEPIAKRTTEPTSLATGEHEGVTGSAQFTMATPLHTYAGGELEAGGFASSGSNIAGAYAVVGAEAPLRIGSIAAELAGGWRSLRYGTGEDDVNALVVEPRVRGNVWLSSQFTFGAALGVALGEHDAWMAGVYLGVHSHAFDSR